MHGSVPTNFLTKVPVPSSIPHTRWEIAAVAKALHGRDEFANAYFLPTGPTAHEPTFPPALVAGICNSFGRTLAAGYVVWLNSIAFHGGTYGVLP